MSKFDDKLSRMKCLMEYKTPMNEGKCNVEFYSEGADGKVYGIIKEGTKFYVKVTEKGKEKISESYNYVNGQSRKYDYAFNSYNDATKHLELKLMSLNEAYGQNIRTSVFDSERSRKTLESLTEEARKELNRMHLVMENSEHIGSKVYKGEDFESKGTASDPVKQSEPFNEKGEFSEEGTKETENNPENANDYTDASKKAEKNLTSDKAPSNAGDTAEDGENAKCDLDGKSVVVKEELEMGGFDGDGEDILIDEVGDEGFETDGLGMEDPVANDIEFEGGFEGEEPEIAGIGDDDDFDSLLEEYEAYVESLEVKSCDKCECDGETCECDSKGAKDGVECTEDALDGHTVAAKATVWDKMDESIANVSKRAFNKIYEQQTLRKEIRKMIFEEMMNVNAHKDFGKHPSFGKEPMTLPQNKEKIVNTGDYDMDDESVKGNERYGKKIGDGAPFNKQVEVLTDSVMAILSEKLGLKKK